MKEIVIFGAQKASINNFYYALKNLKSLKKKKLLYIIMIYLAILS
tara:strand:+ start:125 stop:259 length:135 start_codon:yes stop_codon:yes gene_type:complete